MDIIDMCHFINLTTFHKHIFGKTTFYFGVWVWDAWTWSFRSLGTARKDHETTGHTPAKTQTSAIWPHNVSSSFNRPLLSDHLTSAARSTHHKGQPSLWACWPQCQQWKRKTCAKWPKTWDHTNNKTEDKESLSTHPIPKAAAIVSRPPREPNMTFRGRVGGGISNWPTAWRIWEQLKLTKPEAEEFIEKPGQEINSLWLMRQGMISQWQAVHILWTSSHSRG